MNLSQLFIARPIMTTLVMAAILVFGVLAYQRLPVSDLPNVDFPTILVSASLPGASPDTMASSVATPLEKQFSTIAGIWMAPRWMCKPPLPRPGGSCHRRCRRLRPSRR